MLSIFPRSDFDQALRIRRFFIAAASYTMWIFLVIYCHTQDIFRMSLVSTLGTCLLVIFMNVILYGIFRSGLNKRFQDPSLTQAQILLATFWIMVIAYHLDEARGITHLLYLVAFIFGVFKLNLRQFLILELYALIGYAYVIALLLAHHPDKINLRVEMLYWLVLAAVLTWFSLVGSYINTLRKRLNVTNRELKAAMTTIELSAIHDDLTGTYNRRHLFSIINREKAVVDRGGDTFSLCIFDLDDFKRVNDTCGHQTGDLVLKTLIGEIRKNIRAQDYIARYGGEEFVVILAYADPENAMRCAQRLRDAASSVTFPGLPEDFRITISLGITQYFSPESIDNLISRADTALYRAKLSGKNTICWEGPGIYENPLPVHMPA